MIQIIEDWDFFSRLSGTSSGPSHTDNRGLAVPTYIHTYYTIILFAIYIWRPSLLSFHYTLGGGIYFSEKSTLNHFLFLPHLASNQWHRHPMVSYNKTQVWRQVLFYSFTYLFLVFVQRISCSCVVCCFFYRSTKCVLLVWTEVWRKKKEFS